MDTAILIGAAVLLAAIGAAKLGARLGLPSLLLFLGLGLVLGDSGFGFQFADADLAHQLGFAALALILAEGGFATRWTDIRPALGLAGLLATVGIGVSVAAFALFAHVVLGLSWSLAVLLGAILSPTDAAAVFAVLRHVSPPNRITSVLEAESGLNDAPTVLLVGLATSLVAGTGSHGPADVVGTILLELGGGLAVGIALGVLGVVLLRTFALPATGLYPLATLGWAVLAYGLASWLHVSGFAAIYVCAVLLGNGQLPHRRATRSFAEGVGWIAQIGLFVMLGLLASPGRISWGVVWRAIVVGAFLTFVARPVSVLVCSLPFRIPWRDQAFLSWAGLRGAVPIILATVPLAARIPQATTLFDLVFVFVIVYTLVQGPTLPWLARRLGLVSGREASQIDIEAAPLERIQADLLHIRVPDGSRLAGVSIKELRFPRNVVVSLVVRGPETWAPAEGEVLRAGDELLIVAPSLRRVVVEERLREVDAGGRLAGWRRQRR